MNHCVLGAIIVYIINLFYYDTTLFLFRFVWCLSMTMDISVQYRGRFVPDIMLLTQCY